MRQHLSRSVPAILLAAFFTAACGASTGERTSRNLDVLTREEILEANLPTLDVAVQRLRPLWLNIRQPPSLSTGQAQIVVFLNTQYQGGVEELRNFGPADISELRYLDGPRAAAQLQGYPNTTYVAGAIVLMTPGRGDMDR